MAKRSKRRGNKERQRSALRPFWSGTVTFGLVSVPVNLYPATRSGGASLRMLSPEGTPLARKYYCSKDDRPLDRDDLIRGYEVGDGEYVVVQDEELEALAPRKSRDIDLTRFVPEVQVPPRHFDRAYYLTPAGDTNKAYRLLAEMIEKNDRAGIASFVMRGKEYLVAILAENGILRAETLRFADELREPDDVGIPEPEHVKKSDVTALARLLRKHTRREPPEHALKDRQSERLEEIIEAKRQQGRDVVQAPETAPPEEEEDETGEGRVDLLETIRRSLRSGDGKGSGKNGKKAAERDGSRDGLTELSKEELYDRAQRQNLPGRSKMNKQQLIRALRRK